jgi:lipopolysaccharide transport system permease protein
VHREPEENCDPSAIGPATMPAQPEPESPSAGTVPPEAAAAPEADDRTGLVAEFREMVWELIRYRELLWQMVLRDIRIRYKQAVMGFGWAVFMPVMVVAAGFLVKYAMARIAQQPLDGTVVADMAVKALGWSFFVGALGFATNSLTGNIGLVTKIYFPREVFPLSAVLTQAFDSAVGSAVLLVLLFVLAGVGSSVQLVWVIPLVLLLVLFTAGMALFLSCANVFFRDVKYIVQVIVMFGIFFTPVFYEPELFGPTGCLLMMLNPLAPLLEGLRLAVVEHHNLLVTLAVTAADGRDIVAWHPGYLLYAAAWSVVGSLAAWLMFHRLEFSYAEYI